MFLLPGEKLVVEDKIDFSLKDENDRDLFRQVQELIYQQRKSNETLKHLVQENKEMKKLLLRNLQ